MNTPKPCNTCKHLYYNAMSKDDPGCYTECKKGLPMYSEDRESCPGWLHWESESEEEY